MKSHVLRPLWVTLGLIALVLLFRYFVVPDDFGTHGRNFTYGFHRLSNIDEWKAFPVKYRGSDYCVDCHDDKTGEQMASKHNIIQCENCHGPALEHPDNPELLAIDRSRGLCLRCHANLPYPNSLRSKLVSVEPHEHNPESACVECHNPHTPDLEG